MSFTVEEAGKSMIKLTIECPAEDFDAAIVKAYNKNKNKINVPGFRKGKAPLAMIEKVYGSEMFYEDAANMLIPEAYEKAADECDQEIVSRPEIDVVSIKKGEKFVFTATVAVKPEVVLGTYKGVKVAKQDVKVTAAEVEAEINRTRELNAKKVDVTDRAIENGDETVIDFEGFVDGVAFEGGKGESYPLTIGSGAFIPGFEDQIIGKNIGEEFDVNVTFPVEYHSEALAGKPAVFKVTVKSATAKVLPELNDEYVEDTTEFSTVAEYKADVKKNLEADKAKKAQAAKEEEAVKAAAANATIEIPQPMIESQKYNQMEQFNYRLQAQGLSMEQYMQFTGMDQKKFLDSLEPQAIESIRTRLTLEAVAKAEGIEATDEEFENEIADMAKMYQMDADKVKEVLGNQLQQVKDDIAVRKAAQFLADNAKETKAKKEEADAE